MYLSWGEARDQGIGSTKQNNFGPNSIFVLRNLLIYKLL